jgi:hypothetical protein
MFELFAFGEATTFNLLRPLVKQVAFFAFVKQNSLVWYLLILVRSIYFALYLRGVQYLQSASGRVPVWPFQVKIHDNQVICLLSTALS